MASNTPRQTPFSSSQARSRLGLGLLGVSLLLAFSLSAFAQEELSDVRCGLAAGSACDRDSELLQTCDGAEVATQDCADQGMVCLDCDNLGRETLSNAELTEEERISQNTALCREFAISRGAQCVPETSSCAQVHPNGAFIFSLMLLGLSLVRRRAL